MLGKLSLSNNPPYSGSTQHGGTDTAAVHMPHTGSAVSFPPTATLAGHHLSADPVCRPQLAHQPQHRMHGHLRCCSCSQPLTSLVCPQAPACAQESMLQEAAELSQASFGPTILGAIGRTYLLCGEAASGHLLQGPWASLRQTGQGVKSKVHAARLALKVMLGILVHVWTQPGGGGESQLASILMCCMWWFCSHPCSSAAVGTQVLDFVRYCKGQRARVFLSPEICRHLKMLLLDLLFCSLACAAAGHLFQWALAEWLDPVLSCSSTQLSSA